MKINFPCLLALLLVTSALVPGCDNQRQESGIPVMNESGEPHSHTGNDQLVWVREDIEEGDFRISLGQHGADFHIGEQLEPAAMITRDGIDVCDAVVHVSLMAADSQTVLVDEASTTFEPATETEPAHYAQASFQIPGGAGEFIIRFRIDLPGMNESTTFDIMGQAH